MDPQTDLTINLLRASTGCLERQTPPYAEPVCTHTCQKKLDRLEGAAAMTKLAKSDKTLVDYILKTTYIVSSSKLPKNFQPATFTAAVTTIWYEALPRHLASDH